MVFFRRFWAWRSSSKEDIEYRIQLADQMSSIITC
uniref:Uncharacterized protein n=1 Tax=Utricularia reniformis TaxID=192314 RepID=A0A1Y0B4C7_9LAMI|nr:hypothetical protein AEK19_MT2156 [Utricularia reniformis]ART32305.1 hypothetical protein AEK19_MT2156 [Utricularia reniformis]